MQVQRPAARARRRFRLAIAIAVLAIPPLVPSRAVAADDPLWGSLRVPGGVAALRRVASLGDASRPPSEVVRDLARSWFGTTVRSGTEPRDRLVGYLRHVARAEAAFAAWPDGVSTAAAADPARREAFRNLMDLLGLRVRSAAAGVAVELNPDPDAAMRRRWLSATGTSPDLVVDDLAAGKTVRLRMASGEVPLPLPALFHERVFSSDPPLERLAASPSALLTYYALGAMDSETLAWLAAEPDVFRRLMDDRAAALAAFGHALRVANGAVAVPGGADARLIWEALVDAPVTAPARFVMNLLDRHDGRLAHLYATVAASEPARQAFILGLTLPDPEARRRHAELVRDWFTATNPGWSATLQPLFRPAVDPAFVLLQIDLIDGAAGPDWWPALFTRLAHADGWPSRPEQTLNDLRPLPATAAWVVSYVFENPDDAARRFEWLRYAQRMFATAARTSAPDIEIALRALKDMPALALSLERMGERDPARLAPLARAYRRVAEAGGPGNASVALRSWQGALAVLEQIHRHSPLSAPVRTRLLTSLAAAIPAQPLEPSGQAADWLLRQLLPALFADVNAEDDMEPRVFRLLLTRTGDAGPGAAFTWEGVRYRVDRSGPAAASAARLRAVMPGARLEHLAYLDEAARALAQPPATLAAIEPVAALIDRGRAGWPADGLGEAARNLRRIRADRDRARATRERQKLLAELDALAAELLPGWAYALALSPTDQAARLFSDAARLHQLSSRETTGRWEDFAWRLAEGTTRTPDGASVRGSLLGLDIARAAEHLIRAPGLVGRPASSGSAIHELTVRALVDRIVLRADPGAWQVTSAMVAAVANGRERAAALARGPGGDARAWSRELSRAGISQWRQNQLAWLASRDDGAAARAVFGLTDFWRLGTTAPLPRGWGQSARPLDGCWCASGVDDRPVERFAGYTSPYSTVAMPDLLLRLGELAAALGLPPAVIEPLLPMATQDLLDQLAQIVPDDWQPLTVSQRLTPERFEDYLNALVTRGTLAPPAEPRFDEGRPRLVQRR